MFRLVAGYEIPGKGNLICFIAYNCNLDQVEFITSNWRF